MQPDYNLTETSDGVTNFANPMYDHIPDVSAASPATADGSLESASLPSDVPPQLSSAQTASPKTKTKQKDGEKNGFSPTKVDTDKDTQALVEED